MIRLLLLGATGQVGSSLRSLLAPGFELFAPARDELDLVRGEALQDYVHGLRPGLIVNAAAYTDVDGAEAEPALARAVNAEAPATLARCAEAIGAALIHYSTDYVFDGAKGAAYTESDPPAPLNHYGRTKLAGDLAVMAGGAPYLIFRTGWVYDLAGRNFLLTMQRLLRERAEVRVVNDQLGTPTGSRVIAAATAAILEQAGAHPIDYIRSHCGLYNLACGGQTSWYGFAAAIREDLAAREGRAAVLVPIASSEHPARARRPACTVLDTARLRERFGLTLPGWRDHLQEALREQTRADNGGG